MIEMISKVSQRRLNLIDILIKSKNSIPFTELAEQLSCSERILKDDISEINSDYNEHLVITMSNSEASIKTDLNFGYDNILKDILKSSLSFQILENVFFNDNKSIERMAMDHYTSTSTMYRRAAQINDYFNDKFNIKLNTAPFELVGDEKEIRQFYSQFFSSKTSFFEWPFEKYINEESLESFIYSFIKELPLVIDFAYFRNIKYIVAVHILRLKKGFPIQKKKNNNLDNFINQIMEKHNNFNKFSRMINLELNLDSIKDIFYDFTDEFVMFSSDELISRADTNPKISKSYFKLLSIVKHLSRKYSLTLSNQEILITNLHNTVSLGYKEVPSNFIVQDRIENFLDSYKVAFPDFHEDIKDKFSIYLNEVFDYTDEVILNTMLFNIYTNWDSLYSQLMYKKNKVNIVVLSNSDHLHSHMIKDVISYEIPNHISIAVIEETFIDETVFNTFDIVISNFPIDLNLSNTQIYINSLPNSQDLNNILQEVYRIFHIKNKR